MIFVKFSFITLKLFFKMKKLLNVLTLAVLVLLSSCRDDKLITSENNSTRVTPTLAIESKTIILGEYLIYIKEEAIAPVVEYAGKHYFASRKEKIAFFDEKSLIVQKQLESFLAELNINSSQVTNFYTALHAGFAIKLTSEEYLRLSNNDKVSTIEHDAIQLSDPTITSKPIVDNSNRSIPKFNSCGTTIHGSQPSNSYIKPTVWVLDTGIDTDHPDLNICQWLSRSFIPNTTVEDCHGHGTAIAGIIGAKDNSIGTLGISPNAPIAALKISDCQNNYRTSHLLAAINFVASRGFRNDVVNLSIGAYSPSCGTGSNANHPHQQVIRALGAQQMYVVISAGNDNKSANDYYPACINGPYIYTVANMDCNKKFYTTSNYADNSSGWPIDWIATGVNIPAPGLNLKYFNWTGTSFSAPHVAGIIHAKGCPPRHVGTVTHNMVNYKIPKI